MPRLRVQHRFQGALEEKCCCFWYKNHQPMWAINNLSKKDKYKQEDNERLIKAWIFENVFKK